MLGSILFVLAAIAADPAAGKDFWTAAAEGDFEALAPERQTVAIDELDPVNGWTPLIYAALSGRVDVMELLLLRGAQVNRVGADGSTALAAAAARGHLDAVKFLLQRGADVNRFEGAGQTPLNWAICRGRTEVARLLLDAGADPSKGNRNAFSPLHEAAKHGNVEAIDALVRAGASPDISTRDGCTPLHGAARLGHLEAVHALVKHGADPTAASWGHSALGEAIENGHDEVARTLIGAGADLNLDLSYEETAFIEACKAGRLELARAFRDAGSGLGDWSTSDVEATARAGYEECLTLLIEMGAHVHEDDFAELMEEVVEGGHTAVARTLFRAQRSWRELPADPAHEREDRLMQAIIDADHEAMAAVLAEPPIHSRPLVEAALQLAELHGLYRMDRALRAYASSVEDPILAEKKRVREFVEACRKADEARVTRMLEGSMPATAYDADEEETAIEQAVRGGNLNIIRALVDRGADVNDRRGGGTPFASTFSNFKDDASREVKLGIARLLLERGADPNGFTRGDAWSPLLSASRLGWMEMVSLLLDAGADPNVPSYGGMLPIAEAAMRNHVAVVRVLLERGAKVDMPDDQGRLPLDYARGYLHDETGTVLISAGARVSGQSLPSPLPDLLNGDPAAVESYLARGVSPDARDAYRDMTPLQLIFEGVSLDDNKAANVRLLLEYGATVHESDFYLHTLVRIEHESVPELVRLMVEKGASLNAQSRGYGGNSPLMVIAQDRAKVSLAKVLLELGADPRLRNDRRESARDLAIRGGNQELVERLEEALKRWPQHNDGGNNL